jgi:hypothetical protein
MAGQISIPERSRDFSIPHVIQTDSGASQPPIKFLLVALTPGVKQPGREDDSSTPSSAEVNNGGVVPLLSGTSSWYGT